jgi:Zn-dependent protease
LDLDIRRYTDPLSSLVIPLVLVLIGGIGLPGAAVYLDTRWMGKKQRSLISLAGPSANLLAAVVLLGSGAIAASEAHYTFWASVEFLGLLQVFAVVINLLPIPGLDGFGAIEPWLKPQTQLKLQSVRQWSFFILLGILILPNPVRDLVYGVIFWIFGLLGGFPLAAMDGGSLVQFWRHR